MGSRLTLLPYPAAQGTFHQTGAYRLVRHPMYGGAILAAFGWRLVSRGWVTLGYAILLTVVFEAKARREEAWLLAKHPGYGAYRGGVRKFIPFVY